MLRICRLHDRFGNYRNRTEAVMGYRPHSRDRRSLDHFQIASHAGYVVPRAST